MINMSSRVIKTKLGGMKNLPHEKVELFKTLKAKVEVEMLSARVCFAECQELRY